MSELDDLRRVAYGRTSGPVEEAAAIEARAALARFETSANARPASDRATDGDREDEQDSARARDHRPAAAADADAPVTLTLVDAGDEPGYLHRLASTWRVWAVPAFAAFVIGITVTVASVLLILNASSPSNITPDTNTSQRFLEGSELLDPNAVSPNAVDPGDLDAANQLFARAQEQSDVTVPLDADIDATSTRLVYAADFASAYAATGIEGQLCLLLVTASAASSMTSCADSASFVARGLSATAEINGERVRLSWDGVTVTDSSAK